MRAVVITGASSGIGRACALALDREGFRVFAGVRRSQDADAFQDDASPHLVPIPIDVTEPASLEAAAEQIEHHTAGLFGLINNAGISLAGPLELIPAQELHRLLDINVVGLVSATQTFLPLLRTGHGRIINIGSISGRTVLPFLGAYAASKHAIEAISDSLRMELKPWNIAVALIEPGRVATPLIAKTRDGSVQLMTGASPQRASLYAERLSAMAALEVARPAMPVDATVEAVVHALTARRPRTRYVVGNDARQRLLLQRLPDRVRDRLILRRLQGSRE